MSDFEAIPESDPARPGCEPAQAALQRLMDGEADWDRPEAAAHRVACVECREELALAKMLPGAMTPSVVPWDLTGRVLGAAMASQRRRRIARFAGVGTALAASVLVAIIVLQPSPQMIMEMPSVTVAPRPKDDGVAAKPLGETVSEARDAIVSLTRRTAAETRETSSNLVPNPKLSDKSDTGDGLEPLADAQAGAARSVEPIRTSARRALNLFLRAADPPNNPAIQ